MVLVTQKTSAQSRVFDVLLDIVYRFDKFSPENPDLYCDVYVTIKHPPQILLSEAVVKHLDNLHQFPDRLLLRMFMVMSHSRRTVFSTFGAYPALCWLDDGMTIQN